MSRRRRFDDGTAGRKRGATLCGSPLRRDRALPSNPLADFLRGDELPLPGLLDSPGYFGPRSKSRASVMRTLSS